MLYMSDTCLQQQIAYSNSMCIQAHVCITACSVVTCITVSFLLI